MKLLQRYILGELVRVFLLLVIVLTLMLVFVGVFCEATERGLGPGQILQILPYVVPSMLPFTVPATLLLSVCVAEIDQERLVVEKNIEATMLRFTGEFQQLGSDELSTLDRATATARKDELRYRAEIHNRFSMSASCCFFAFLGGPFAMLQARRQFITSFILCFLPILIMYYPVMFLMINLCKTGTLEPWWAMWVPNLVIGGIGLLVLRKVVQH